MPNTKSAIRRTRSNARKEAFNRAAKDKIKTARKEFQALVKDGKKAEAAKLLGRLSSALDKAAKTRAIHKNKASRLKAGFARLVK